MRLYKRSFGERCLTSVGQSILSCLSAERNSSTVFPGYQSNRGNHQSSPVCSNFKMKQKLVLQLDMFDEKRRSKAMKTVVAADHGVSSVAVDEKDKRKLVVIGEDMDAIQLVSSLRKKNFCVEMESLEQVKSGKKDGGKENEKPAEKKPAEQWSYVYQPTDPRHFVYHRAVHPAAYYDAHIQPDPSCSIM
ncbi:unnamed protein product [Victoria cruziana]